MLTDVEGRRREAGASGQDLWVQHELFGFGPGTPQPYTCLAPAPRTLLCKVRWRVRGQQIARHPRAKYRMAPFIKQRGEDWAEINPSDESMMG